MLVSKEEAQALSERLIKAVSAECQRTGTTVRALAKLSGVDEKVLYYWVNGLRLPQAFWVIVSMQDTLTRLKDMPDDVKRKELKEILK